MRFNYWERIESSCCCWSNWIRRCSVVIGYHDLWNRMSELCCWCLGSKFWKRDLESQVSRVSTESSVQKRSLGLETMYAHFIRRISGFYNCLVEKSKRNGRVGPHLLSLSSIQTLTYSTRTVSLSQISDLTFNWLFLLSLFSCTWGSRSDQTMKTKKEKEAWSLVGCKIT